MSITPGAIRFNTDSMKLEYYHLGSVGVGTLATGEWVQITTDTPDVQTGGTRGVFSGLGGYPNITNVMNYVNVDSTGNAIDFGDLTLPTRYGNAVGSRTRGIVYEGITPATNQDVTFRLLTSI